MKCSRCEKEITEGGHVHWILVPVLVIALGLSPGRTLCAGCADAINGIGALVLKVVVVAAALGALMHWAQG